MDFKIKNIHWRRRFGILVITQMDMTIIRCYLSQKLTRMEAS